MGAVSRLALVAAAALLLVVAGCSDDGAAPVTTATSSSSTTEPTTSSTTTSSTTTSTTIDPVSEVEAEVEAAYLRSYEVYIECYRTLPDCDPNEVFPDVYASPTLQRQVLAALESQADDFVYGPPNNPDNARTEVLDIALGDEMDTAVVSFCTLAGDLEYKVNGDGTRTPTDDNDTILVEWGDAVMLRTSNGWRVSDYPNEIGDVVEFPLGDLDKRIEEGTLCYGFLEN